jgi:hypothetical protein
MAEFDPDKFLAEDNIAESKSFDPDEFLSETTPDVKKRTDRTYSGSSFTWSWRCFGRTYTISFSWSGRT